jgi:hypothetical protein
MKTVFFIFLLGGALIILVGIVGLGMLWARGSQTVFLPGVGIVISMAALLLILSLIEAVLILLTVLIWRY